MPPNARSVTRPGPYGNPFRIGDAHPEGRRIETAAQSVAVFRRYAIGRLKEEPGWLAPLRGRDLACFCPPGAPCHADVLLDLANG